MWKKIFSLSHLIKVVGLLKEVLDLLSIKRSSKK